MENMQSLVSQLGLSPDVMRGKVAVVTGAGQGIGRAAAMAMASIGASVVIAELSASGAKTAETISAGGAKAAYVRTDVSSQESVRALFDQTETIYGPVDILVNNAILCPATPFLEMDEDLWDRVVAVNLKGAFLTCRAFLPGMVSRGSGTVINMVSLDAMPGLSAYISTKQALVGLSQTLAVELGKTGVRIVAFAPGMVDTPGLRGAARGLAPLLGMTEAEFGRISLHPAYEGLMPVEHAGVATAYLAARLTADYNGEVVDGYTVLEKAGLISRTEIPDVAAEAPSPHAAEQINGEWRRRLMEKAESVDQLISAIGAEFEKLPFFARPMARKGFKDKSGATLPEWGRTCEDLKERLRLINAGDSAAPGRLQEELPRLRALLKGLSKYCAGVPAETARFTRDTAFLSEVAKTAAERVQMVNSLIEAMDRLVQ
jgi:NAD(P)-dependent dehydrogenase (short-subunit alcohol dehydrogenase family)